MALPLTMTIWNCVFSGLPQNGLKRPVSPFVILSGACPREESIKHECNIIVKGGLGKVRPVAIHNQIMLLVIAGALTTRATTQPSLTVAHQCPNTSASRQPRQPSPWHSGLASPPALCQAFQPRSLFGFGRCFRLPCSLLPFQELPHSAAPHTDMLNFRAGIVRFIRARHQL